MTTPRGHIQTVVADPKHPGLGYFYDPATPASADERLKGPGTYVLQ